MADLRLQCPFTMVVASPSKSGKSTLVKDLILKSDSYFSHPPEQIYYFYNVWSSTFDELKEAKRVTKFIKGVCTAEWLEEMCEPGANSNITIVLDDQAMNITKDVAEVFSVGSHQYGVNFILLAQNLFTKNKYFRDASLNATYIVLGKNPRDQSSVRHLAQQMFPVKSKELVDAYHLATREPYSHLLLDFNQDVPEDLRMRSNILSKDRPMSIYIKK